MPAIVAKPTDTGQWKKAVMVTSPRFWERTLKLVWPRMAKRIGEQYIENVKKEILQGQVGGPPLSAAWVAQKGNDIPWLDEGDLLKSLAVWYQGAGIWAAGVTPGATNRRGVSIEMIATSLENGTIFIPARPVFAPVAQKMASQASMVGRLANNFFKRYI